MRTLIVYYSFSGNNEYLAKELQSRLDCDILKIEEIRKRTGLTILWDIIFNRGTQIRNPEVKLSAYNSIIFIAPIWAGKICTPLRSFIRQTRKDVEKYSFITICGGRTGQKEKVRKELEELTKQEALAVEELWVNDLLPPDKKNKSKYATAYRIKQGDFSFFEPKVENFINVVTQQNPQLVTP